MRAADQPVCISGYLRCCCKAQNAVGFNPTVCGKKLLTPILEAKEIDITTEMTRKARFGVRKDCAACERVIISLSLPPDEGKVGRFDGETQLDRLPLLRWDQFGGDGGTRCSHVFCFVHPFLRDVDHRKLLLVSFCVGSRKHCKF